MEEPKRKKTEYRSSQRSKLLIRNALVSLMREKPFDKISITDIVKRADINRGTFYAHYKNQEEVLEKIYFDFATDIHKLFQPNQPILDVLKSPSSFFNSLSKFLLNDYDYYHMLFSVAGRTNIIEINKQKIIKFFSSDEILSHIRDKERFITMLSFLIGGVMELYFDAVQGVSVIKLADIPDFVSPIFMRHLSPFILF